MKYLVTGPEGPGFASPEQAIEVAVAAGLATRANFFRPSAARRSRWSVGHDGQWALADLLSLPQRKRGGNH
ncbi:MAG: hypothetical protein ACREX4_05705 [Gammaproteobacteria bacterium]